MSTKLNFTNRMDLDPSFVVAKILVNPHQTSEYEFHIEIDLSAVLLVGEFDIVFTYKAIGETKRVEMKKQSNKQIIATHSLRGMRKPLDVVAYIKIIQLDKNLVPIIRASIRNVIPEVPGNQSAQRSALKTKRDPDLKVPWRLYFTEEYPILHVSDKNGLYDQLFSTPQFDPLILSEVVRQVFIWLVFDPGSKDQYYVDIWKKIFEDLGCDQAFFDDVPTPHEDDGSMEGMTPGLRDTVLAMSFQVSDRFTADFNLLGRLSNIKIGDE